MDLDHHDRLFISKENTAIGSKKSGCITEENLKTPVYEQQRTLKYRSSWEMESVWRGEIYSGQSQLDQKVGEPQNSLCEFGLFYFNKHR